MSKKAAAAAAAGLSTAKVGGSPKRVAKRAEEAGQDGGERGGVSPAEKKTRTSAKSSSPRKASAGDHFSMMEEEIAKLGEIISAVSNQ